jgi:hypothetical protein
MTMGMFEFSDLGRITPRYPSCVGSPRGRTGGRESDRGLRVY